MNPRHHPFVIEKYDLTRFAQCTSCFAPMVGILDAALRKDCHGCIIIAREMYGVDKRKCKGL
jgi:hypothetical protein